MARPRSVFFEDHRKHILSQAARLFAQHGYLGTTMTEVADACGLSKPTLYHYYKDKDDLLLSIADGHVSALVELVDEVERGVDAGPARLRTLIERFLQVYANAHHQHRVLTEDVRFLRPPDRKRVLDKERRVVAAFADAIAAIRPDLKQQDLTKPLAMLLFGMLNWLFTWWRPDGPLGPEAITPIITDLFFGGLEAVRAQAAAAPPAPRSSRRRPRENIGA
jgi:TetR/AcrR family transcriptional regulator